MNAWSEEELKVVEKEVLRCDLIEEEKCLDILGHERGGREFHMQT